ncbi:hypothetical protein AOX55_00006695 (plasmid) [Sinorhizobium fredii CCBAU 25509]|nr:hypothetical protein AOX55_00006695 [Sinorhizobium fredii CCBAU 25509]
MSLRNFGEFPDLRRAFAQRLFQKNVLAREKRPLCIFEVGRGTCGNKDGIDLLI